MTCLKRRLSEVDGEADSKAKELDRQLKAMSQEKENVGRVSICAVYCITSKIKPC